MNDVTTPISGGLGAGGQDRISELEEEFEKLRRRVEATKTIRFRSHVRLLRRHKFSSYVIAMLSIYVIAISLMPTFFDLTFGQAQVLLACTIVLSTFIIVLILTEGYENFNHQAHIFHNCARACDSLLFQITISKKMPQTFKPTSSD